MSLKKIIICLLFFLLPGTSFSYAQQHAYTIDQFPDPKATGNNYVSNPDGVLSSAAVDSLNTTIATLEGKTKIEIAVAVVSNFEENEDPYNFALNLFRKWGVGKSKANNGLLLFIATDRKQYRFITGYGLEGLLPDAALKRIGDHYFIPAFRAGNYGYGTNQALQTIASYLEQPANRKELEQLLGEDKKEPYPWIPVIAINALVIGLFALTLRDIKKKTPRVTKEKAKHAVVYDKANGIGCGGLILLIIALVVILGFGTVSSWFKEHNIFNVALVLYVFLSFILLFRYLNALSAIRKANVDDLSFNTAVQTLNQGAKWYLIGSPLILLVLIIEGNRQKKSAGRFKPLVDSQNMEMSRVDRNKNKNGTPYLSKGQQKEEKLGVNTYDIWISKNEQKVLSYPGAQYSSFDLCPECNFRTFSHQKTVPVINPTYQKEGEGKKVRICENCGYEELIKMIVLPILSTRDKDSGSSGSSDSSSSDSGSWGGGETGGGGAGGNW